jgi:hypothetical protein
VSTVKTNTTARCVKCQDREVVNFVNIQKRNAVASNVEHADHHKSAVNTGNRKTYARTAKY